MEIGDVLEVGWAMKNAVLGHVFLHVNVSFSKEGILPCICSLQI